MSQMLVGWTGTTSFGLGHFRLDLARLDHVWLFAFASLHQSLHGLLFVDVGLFVGIVDWHSGTDSWVLIIDTIV